MNRIRELRKAHHMSQTQLAQALCISQGTLSFWENERYDIDNDGLLRLSELFDVTTDYILGRSEKEKPALNLAGLEYYRPKGRIPVLGKVSAGAPLLAEQNIEGYVACDREDADTETYFALRVHGDSMTAAGIADGDLVIVRQQSAVDDGELAVVLVNGDDATVKRFSQRGNNVFLSPQSYNAEHQTQVYDIRETSVRVLGRVVECRKQF